ncbi:MAG: atpF [Candidatus Saccharibacteria bacterium]|nr:atpF [Candidatus Saccharibacteria bacterium]
MLPTYFAAEASSGGILGFSTSAFLIQLITFIFVFLVLKRFAFKPIVALLEKRRQTIEDGILLGEKMEKRQAELEGESDKVIREARHDADRIIANAHKESREVLREAEKSAKAKSDAIIKEADAHIEEDADRARRNLEKDLVGLVSEATEAVVHEKVTPGKDAEIVSEALKGRKK